MARRLLRFYPKGMTVHEKIDHLARLSPKDAEAIEKLITDTLKRRWPAWFWWPKRGRPLNSERKKKP